VNTIHLGDCLFVIRESIPPESVDLIYIDPPFNSNRNYNIFFDDKEIQSQRIAFEDTWTLKNISESLMELHTMKTERLYKYLLAIQDVSPGAFPYLTMMSLRIIEMHRALKDTGSFYLHCDPTMSHHLKILCDLIFGEENFRNEIIWDYSFRLMDLPHFYNRKHDVILFYAKTSNNYFKMPKLPWTKEELLKSRKQKIHVDKNGVEWIWSPGGKGHSKNKLRRIDKILADGKSISDVWPMPIISSSSNERLGYPTQKPKVLLERIIAASSKKGDVILDAFCGCGTTVDAAEGLERKWIGIDISPIAVALIERRLKKGYGNALQKYEVRGIPVDAPSARALWQENPFAFQDWWVTQFEAFSSTFGTKGADEGVDGIALFATDGKGGTIRAAFQVKGGKVQSKDIDALIGAMQKHGCELGVFLTSEKATKPMMKSASKSGIHKIPGFAFPKVQILTLDEFFGGKRPKLPDVNITFKASQYQEKKSTTQAEMDL